MPAEPWRSALRLVAAIGLLALAPGRLHAQVSPGPLARAHAALEGNRNCFQCHPAAGSGGRMDDRCLACHGEIATLRAAGRGLHARVASQPCAKCHPDHGGTGFDLVAFEEGSPAKFDHARTGYSLDGAHAKVECRSCHQPKNQRAAVVAKMKVRDHSRSWLGLETACASCHGDPHRGQLAARCESCHGMAAWSPLARFDHARTAFPLTGAHATVACAKCHAGAGDAAAPAAAARWKPVAHAECSNCHRDPHAGRFGAKCASCHDTGDFHRIRGANFDHSKTRYPLTGAHATVACARCHDDRTAFGPRPAFDRCDRCHADAHAGQTAAAGGAAPDCMACHTVSGFHPSTFTLAAHQQTGYPLTGAHARAACAGCHAAGPAAAATTLGRARVPLHPEHGECTSCHGDPHRGRFAAGGARALAAGCLGCHDVERFSPSKVDARAHDGFGFGLRGAHRAVPCAACHRELSGRVAGAGGRTLRGATLAALEFHDERRKCAECHDSPHGDQFDHRRDHGACESCHDEEAFAPAAKFDHERDSAFKLEGAHAKVPCASCHATVHDGGRSRVVYRPLSTRCEACHDTR
jgi:hypothetical protein